MGASGAGARSRTVPRCAPRPGEAQGQYGLAPRSACADFERVALHADLTMLARFSPALSLSAGSSARGVRRRRRATYPG